jgi:hypothetical protein
MSLRRLCFSSFFTGFFSGFFSPPNSHSHIIYLMEKSRPLALVGKLVGQELAALFGKAFPEAGPVLPLVQHEMRLDYDYASPTAIKVFNMHKDKKTGLSLGCGSARELAERICAAEFNKFLISELKPSEQGFIQVTLGAGVIEEQVSSMLTAGLVV